MSRRHHIFPRHSDSDVGSGEIFQPVLPCDKFSGGRQMTDSLDRLRAVLAARFTVER